MLVLLAAARDPERPRRHVFGDRAPGRHVGALPDANGGDELAVAPDEDVVLDNRSIFAEAVIIAGDRAGPDVDVAPDGGVAQVGQVRGLGAVAQRALLDLDEVPHFDSILKLRVHPKVGEGPDRSILTDRTVDDDATIQNGRARSDCRPASIDGAANQTIRQGRRRGPRLGQAVALQRADHACDAAHAAGL